MRPKGIISIDPPKLGAAYPILVPQVNRDGIDAGGILSPEVAVPLGTFTGWNYSVPVYPNLGYLGGLVGSFIPFPLTAAERKASGDSRLSVAERYTGRDDYLDQVRAAAESLVSRRLLRADDVNAVVAESAAALGLSGGIGPMKVPYEFVVEALTPLAPTVRRFFSGFAVYIGPKFVLILHDSPNYPADNGVWLATTASPP